MYCKHCGNQIETDWSTCPYCGAPLEEPVNGSSVSTAPESRPPYQRWWFWVIVILAAALVVLFGLYTLGSGTEDPSKPAAATETTLSAEALAKQQEKKEAALRAEYIFPDSDSKYLSEEEVRSVEVDQLRIGRNEIFARHGYIFKDKDLKNHFKNTSWYHGTVSSDSFDSDAVFNDFEKKNVALIKKIEDEINGPSKEEVEKQTAIDRVYNSIVGKTFYSTEHEGGLQFNPDGELIVLGYYGSAPRLDKYTTYSLTARYDIYKDGVYEWLVFLNVEGVDYYIRYFTNDTICLAGDGELDGWYDANL